MYSRILTSVLLEESIRAGTPLEKGTPSGDKLRPKLAKDNQARLSSQTGKSGYNLSFKDSRKGNPAAQQPRLYSSKPNHK